LIDNSRQGIQALQLFSAGHPNTIAENVINSLNYHMLVAGKGLFSATSNTFAKSFNSSVRKDKRRFLNMILGQPGS